MITTPITRKAAPLSAAAALAAALIVLVPAAAHADPISAGRTYQIAGAKATEDVFDGITNGYASCLATQSDLGSWRTGGMSTISPKVGGQVFGRPHGSREAVDALSASWSPLNDVVTQTVGTTTTAYDLKNGVGVGGNDGVRELDFARSASKPVIRVAPGSANDKLTYVPFARDAVGIAFQAHGAGAAVTDLSVAAMTFVFGTAPTYPATYAGVGYSITKDGVGAPVYTDTATGASRTLRPVLPEAKSETRSFFLGAIGVGPIGGWVLQAGENENDATVLDGDGELIPFSVPQWIAQRNGVIASSFTGTNAGTVMLLNVAGVAPVTSSGGVLAPNTAYFGSPTAVPSSSVPLARDMFVVVPTANYSAQAVPLLALRDLTCGVRYVVQDFGFLRLTYTGTVGQWHTSWTN